MAINKRAVLAAITGAMLLGAASAPVSAQRYCQRELADDDPRDEGCTAPVGGGIGVINPIGTFGARTTSTEQVQTDEEKLDQLVGEVSGQES